MPTVIETTVYTFDELSDSAKDKARNWFRGVALDYDWWDSCYEDAQRMGALMGITIGNRTYKTMGGGTGTNPDIYFDTGRGAFASFAGSYRYAKGGAKAVRTETGNSDADLVSIADALQAIQRKYFYGIYARMSHGNERICIEIGHDRFDYLETGDDSVDATEQCLRDFASWILKQLRNEYEYRMSDEAVDEDIRANEYTFTESGRRAG